ncbi:MAG TPA: diguanylate cyclase [Smithella sp.]|nr:diguanylate cyclase [Smithella sp.]
MNDKSLRALIVEKSEDDTLLLVRTLKKGGYNPVYERVQTPAAMKKALEDKEWDIIFCDHKLPTFRGPLAMALLKEANVDIPLIVVSGVFDETMAVKCMRLNAENYIVKTNFSRLCPVIDRELEDAEVDKKQMQIEEQSRTEEQRYRAFVENSSDIIVVMNRQGTITYINPAIEKVLGFTIKDRIGRSIFENLHPDDLHRVTEAFKKFISEEDAPPRQNEIRIHGIDGNWHTFESVSKHLGADENTDEIIVNLRDITDRKRSEEHLRESEQKYLELSIIDDLTQLYNSRHFNAQLEKEIERSNRYQQPLTILLLDLDDFKLFNDTYGHVEGDYVLSRVGVVIKRCLRETDSAYRYGGEEFTVILPMTTSEEGLVTAKRIQAELKKEAFYPAGQEVHLTVSTGLSQYRLKEEMKAFVHRVDRLMYDAKEKGKDRICSEP